MKSGWSVAVVLFAIAGASFVLASRGPLKTALDRDYAGKVFDGVVVYDKVLESRINWAEEPDDVWGCTYAVVQLPADPAQTPGRRAGGDVPWNREWGGDWQSTPVDHPPDGQRDAVRECADNWSPDVGARLLTAISEPGSFYANDSVGETIFIYSAKRRIAARIRYGD